MAPPPSPSTWPRPGCSSRPPARPAAEGSSNGPAPEPSPPRPPPSQGRGCGQAQARSISSWAELLTTLPRTATAEAVSRCFSPREEAPPMPRSAESSPAQWAQPSPVRHRVRRLRPELEGSRGPSAVDEHDTPTPTTPRRTAAPRSSPRPPPPPPRPARRPWPRTVLERVGLTNAYLRRRQGQPGQLLVAYDGRFSATAPGGDEARFPEHFHVTPLQTPSPSQPSEPPAGPLHRPGERLFLARRRPAGRARPTSLRTPPSSSGPAGQGPGVPAASGGRTPGWPASPPAGRGPGGRWRHSAATRSRCRSPATGWWAATAVSPAGLGVPYKRALLAAEGADPDELERLGRRGTASSAATPPASTATPPATTPAAPPTPT